MSWQAINKKRIKHIRYGERLFYRLEKSIAVQFSQAVEKANSTEQITANASFDISFNCSLVSASIIQMF